MKEELTQKDEQSKVYEVGFHLLPTIAENSIAEEVSKIKSVVEKNNGVFVSEGVPQMTNLAYTITKAISGKNQKFDSAYFGWVKFELGASVIADIKKEMDEMDVVLRYLIIKTVKEDATAVKPGKFEFNSGSEVETTDNKKEKKEKEEVVKKEEVKEEKPEEVTENKEEEDKKLDNTIDDLVID